VSDSSVKFLIFFHFLAALVIGCTFRQDTIVSLALK
jgi:hypothetical protein